MHLIIEKVYKEILKEFYVGKQIYSPMICSSVWKNSIGKLCLRKWKRHIIY